MDTPPAAPPPQPAPLAISSEDKILAVLCHASILVGGLGYLIVPLIIYLLKRETSPFAGFHAKEALNFHLSLLIYVICTLPLLFIFSCLFMIVGIPLYGTLALVVIIFAIIASVRASEGAYYLYPLTIRFF
jgi:uncharacterized Tic20 family protein